MTTPSIEKRRSWPGDHPCALCYMRYWHSQAECSKPIREG
jgi:hypothetical protein